MWSAPTAAERGLALRMGIVAAGGIAAWTLVALLPPLPEVIYHVFVPLAMYGAIAAMAWAGALAPRSTIARIAAVFVAAVAVTTIVQVGVGAYWAAPLKIAMAPLIAACIVALVERLSWVLGVAVLISASDLWSVYSSAGVTNSLASAEQGSTGASIVDALAIRMPAPDALNTGFLGFVDVLFACLFVQIAVLWALGVQRTLVAIGASLLALDLVMTLDLVDFLPALPGMAFAFCVAHWRLLRAAIRDDVAALSAETPAQPGMPSAD